MSTRSIKSKQQKTGIAMRTNLDVKQGRGRAKRSDALWSKFADTSTIVIFYDDSGCSPNDYCDGNMDFFNETALVIEIPKRKIGI